MEHLFVLHFINWVSDSDCLMFYFRFLFKDPKSSTIQESLACLRR
jgi:hypothetical protein